MIEDGAITYLHTDRTGSVVATSDSQGNVLARYQISEWGELQPSQLGGPPFRFIGARFDPETGLYYMRARYYSPELGRFVETDPAGYGQSTNLYGYGANSPLVFADPSGEWTVEAALIAAAVAAVVSTVVQAEVNGGDYSQVNYRQVAISSAQAFALAVVGGELFGASESSYGQLAFQGDQAPIVVTGTRNAGLSGAVIAGAVIVAALATTYYAVKAFIDRMTSSSGSDSGSPPPPTDAAGSQGTPPEGPDDPNLDRGAQNATDAEVARRMGYTRTRDVPFDAHGQRVYSNGSRYITRDVDAHKGGYWKLFNRRGQRLGTFNQDLTSRIGD